MQGGVYHQLFMGFFFPLSICVSISIFAVRSSPHHHHLTALHKGAQAHTHWWCMCIRTIPSSVWQKLTHTYSKKAPSAFLPLSVFSLQTYTTLSHTHTHRAWGWWSCFPRKVGFIFLASLLFLRFKPSFLRGGSNMRELDFKKIACWGSKVQPPSNITLSWIHHQQAMPPT